MRSPFGRPPARTVVPARHAASRRVARGAASILALTLLAACATGGDGPGDQVARVPSQPVYDPPARAPAGGDAVLVRGGQDDAFVLTFARLSESGYEVAAVSAEANRSVIAVYQDGDPEPYVDCGTLTVFSDVTTAPTVYPAAAQQVGYVIANEEGRFQIDRQMRMNARILLTIVQIDDVQSEVGAQTQYVLTKILEARNPENAVLAESVETADFASGTVGQFERDTNLRCVANGRLEAELLGLLTAEPVS